MKTKHVGNISGGKDSDCVYLLGCEYADKKGIDFLPVMADTGNEHPATFEHVKTLHLKTGGPKVQIVRQDFTKRFVTRRENIQKLWPRDGVKQDRIDRAIELMQPTGNPFLDLCLLKGRFPSTRARFCTQELKIFPIRDQIVKPLLDQDYRVLRWVGVRRDESRARAYAKRWEQDPDFKNDLGSWIWRPIVTWTIDDVFAMHRKHGLEPNPLYRLGCSRVGCMPCIHEDKASLANIAARFPEEFERVAEWECIVSEACKRGRTSFFSADKTPGPHTTDHSLPMPTVLDVAEWSKTSRGGTQYDLITALHHGNPPQCSSYYGLCE